MVNVEAQIQNNNTTIIRKTSSVMKPERKLLNCPTESPSAAIAALKSVS